LIETFSNQSRKGKNRMHASDSFMEDPTIRERFGDLHAPLTHQAAVVESNRCLNCFDAPCMAACPTHIDVPGFIKRIASGNLRGSARRILEANVLAGSCSRVCPVEVLCEGACVMHRHHQAPIPIALLQRHAMDAFHQSGEPLLPVMPASIELRVACIGSGPASLACAAELRRHGAQVTVFDSRALPGGLNTYGVAEYKLPTADSLREVELIRNMGVEFRMNSAIETAADLQALEVEFDYVFVGVGLGAMQRLGIPGESDSEWPLPVHATRGVLNALQLIASYKTGHITEMKGAVVVVGAGNTAIDAAIAARRLGADQVTMLYRRGPMDISAFDFEFKHAREEGVQFLWRHLPVAMRHAPDGSLQLDIQAVRLAHGKFELVDGSVITLSCHTIIPAIGQSPLTKLLSEFRHVAIDKGIVVTDRLTGETTNPRFFAGGDCANGGREVVDAVADGKRAAIGILQARQSAAIKTEVAHV
jgi:dihydropyrimidine dehydrogenase (NAD+) subunit PreT